MRYQNTSYCAGRFPQRTRAFYHTAEGLPGNSVLSLAYDSEGCLWAGTEAGLARLAPGEAAFRPVAEAAGLPVSVLLCGSDGAIWAGAGRTLLVFCASGLTERSEWDSEIAALAQGLDGTLWLLTENALYRREGTGWEELLGIPGEGSCLAVRSGYNVYVGTKASGLLALTGKRWHWSELYARTTPLVSDCIRCLSFDETEHLWIGTDRGLCVYNGTDHWLTPEGTAGLPQGDLRACIRTPEGGLCFATPFGLMLWQGGQVKYLGYKRWVPSPDVRCLALGPDGALCAGTADGLSIIQTEEMTLAQKAAHYQAITERYHVRRDGFVTVRALTREGDIASGKVEISDNDGLWTGCYAAAQAYRYAVTGEEEAAALARRSILAMVRLAQVSSIPGFTARAIRYPGEEGFGNGDPEWHLSTEGDCEWKGETSSDEMVGHFYAYSLYYDLVADDREKAMLAGVVSEIMDHILRNGYHLVDTDGQPTTWAVWNPDQLNHDNKWMFEHGVNSLEILSFLKTAHHMTGRQEYDDAYRTLVTKHHYAMNVAQHKVEDAHVCHIDDELAFLTSVPLLRYEQDPSLRAFYLMGLEHHWQYERVERTPLWNIIYGAMTGHVCDIEAAAESLALMPLDLIRWQTFNSHRQELVWDSSPEQLGEPRQLERPLPYDEKPLNKYDGNPFRADTGCPELTQAAVGEPEGPNANPMLPGGGDDRGTAAEDGSVFLHPYWMGRYFGLLREEE